MELSSSTSRQKSRSSSSSGRKSHTLARGGSHLVQGRIDSDGGTSPTFHSPPGWTENAALHSLKETSSTLSPFALQTSKQEIPRSMYTTETKERFENRLPDFKVTETLGNKRAVYTQVKSLLTADHEKDPEAGTTMHRQQFTYDNLMTEALLETDKSFFRKRDGFTQYTEACARNPHFRK